MKSPRGFTWVEVLIVVALLGILAVLLLPSVSVGPNSNLRAQAKNDVVQIATAITAFHSEYGHLPTTSANVQEVKGPLVQALTGAPSPLNPRRIVFLEVPPAKKGKGGLRDGAYIDPWGSAYKLKCDTDLDGKIESVGPAHAMTAALTNKVVAVWNDPSTHRDWEDARKKLRRFVASWE